METKIGDVLNKKSAAPDGNGAHKKFKVTFLPMQVTVEVNESQFPLQHDGKPGSLLDIALAHGLKMGHNCGGNCACTTCHVVVKEGMDNLSPMQQDEEDRLDIAEGLTLSSRLGCQAVVKGDVVAEIMEEGEAGH